MKKLASIILLLLVAKLGWTQNIHLDYKHALKLYNLTSYEQYSGQKMSSTQSPTMLKYTTTNFQLFHPTIAIQWKSKENNFHEIELTRFNMGKSQTKMGLLNDSINPGVIIGGDRLFKTEIAVRYEYILTFNKTEESKFVPAIGFGVNPYFKLYDLTPMVSFLFPSTDIYVGSQVFVIPRLSYYFSKKLFLEINIPICFFDTSFQFETVANPILPFNQQRTTTFTFDQFPKIFSGRIGLGLKI